MKTISKISLSLAIGVISLSGCKSKNETFGSESFDDKAYFESLRKDAYKSKTSTQTDIKALSDLLPEALNLTYDNISYSQTNGATTLSNVNLTVADSDFGVNIETLLLWDVNETAITERLSGENLNNDFRLLSRLEAHNLSMFGLEAAFNSLMGASNDITQKILEDAINDDSDLSDAFPTQTFDNYEISLENFIVTDIKIHPWVLNLTQAPFTEGEVSTDANNIWHFYQKIAAWSYAFSYEDMAAYDGVFELEMTQDDIPLSLDMDIGLLAYKGYSRGDMEYGAVHDTKYVMDMATPISPDSVNRTVNTASSIEAYTYENR